MTIVICDKCGAVIENNAATIRVTRPADTQEKHFQWCDKCAGKFVESCMWEQTIWREVMQNRKVCENDCEECENESDKSKS